MRVRVRVCVCVCVCVCVVTPQAFWGSACRLEAIEGAMPPMWSDGLETWEAVRDGKSCGVGETLSGAARGCEWCPLGTFQSGLQCLACEVHTSTGGRG